MERLSSGFRINRAGDDAAGLSISEKMRGQIRGLKQASRNAQDGISLLQTAEGALNETHAILQRMRVLAVQASNDTNTEIDRNEIQKEINQLTSEINRIGNTTEFNTQKLLKGDKGFNVAQTGVAGIQNLSGGDTVHTQATVTFATKQLADSKTDTINTQFTIQGKTLEVELVHQNGTAGSIAYHGTSANTATVIYSTTDGAGTTGTVAASDVAIAMKAALEALIANDSDLAGNYQVSIANGNEVTISAIAGEKYDGAAGTISDVVATDAVDGGTAVAGTTTESRAKTEIDLATVKASDLVGKGWTINGQTVEFYDANNGKYEGEAIGINVGSHDGTDLTGAVLATLVSGQLNELDGVRVSADTTKLVVEADQTGKLGNGIEFKDGGVKENFRATFQVGANQGQSMTIEIADMRSLALNISGTEANAKHSVVEGAKFIATKNVTDGTSNVGSEYALDVSNHESAAAAVTVINNAIENVSAQRSQLGAYQNRLEHTIANLGTSAENLQAAESRIRDLDMAEEITAFTKNNILQQAATAMLAQANMAPQSVLQLLG